VTASQMPVFMRGAAAGLVEVKPGDFILGDEDGVIVIPAGIAEPVLLEVERLTEIEKNIRSELKNGLSLAEALKKFGHV
jgi:regulator of RNase E activity RraA